MAVVSQVPPLSQSPVSLGGPPALSCGNVLVKVNLEERVGQMLFFSPVFS